MEPFIIFILIVLESEYVFMSGEKKLINTVLTNYKSRGKIGRPVKNVQEIVVVNYGLALIQIMSLDEKNQILSINVWAKYTWVDEMLQWDPKNFLNVEEIKIPPDKIWTPDIVLYNYADERLVEKRDVMLSVNYNGSILWMPPAIFKSTCQIDISNFPFDYQTCYLKFGSWTYKGDKLDIQLYENSSEIDIIDYTESNEWLILHRPARRFVMVNKKDNSSNPDLTFFLILKRNSAYHAYLLVVPCVLLSTLTLCIFWLPPESPAKMVLGMNIFVAFSLLLRLLAETTPSASTSVPYLGCYYCLNMILITLSTFLSIIVINLYFRCDKKKDLPAWLRKAVNTTSELLGMRHVIASLSSEKLNLIKWEIKNLKSHMKRTYERTNQSQETIPTPSSFIFQQKSSFKELEMQYISGVSDSYPSRLQFLGKVDQENVFRNSSHVTGSRSIFNSAVFSDERYRNSGTSSTKTKQLRQSNLSAMLLEKNISKIRDALKNVMTKIAEKDRGNRIAREWRIVAMILDRVFFWLYFVTIILSGLTLLIPRGLPKSMETIIDEYSKMYDK